MSTIVHVVQAAYDKAARANRPDWEAFIEEAQQDPAMIAYEWCDTAIDLGYHPDAAATDDLFRAAQTWVAGLRRA